MDLILSLIINDDTDFEIMFKSMFNIKNVFYLFLMYILIGIVVRTIFKLFKSTIYRYFFIGIFAIILILMVGILVVGKIELINI